MRPWAKFRNCIVAPRGVDPAANADDATILGRVGDPTTSTGDPEGVRALSDLEFEPIAYPLGARITGVDLSKDISAEVLAELRAALANNLMVCFPDQRLSREDIVTLASRFGQVDDNATVKHRDPENPYVTMLTSKPFSGKPWETFKNGDNWHSDRSYRIDPTSFTLLYAREMPAVGGNTMFANQYLSYEALSDKLRAFVDDCDVIHLQNLKASKIMVNAAPAVIQPLARVHPETSKRSLYLGYHARAILGMTEEESRPILDYLTAHATRPEFTYRHKWAVNELVMWDNRCTMHVALRDYDLSAVGQSRHLWKCSVRGEVSGKLYTDVFGARYEQESAEHPELVAS
jgi:taurine dioxygenase